MATTISAASASAAMAAAGGFDKRVSTSSSLQTPGSGTFPSEMLSPMAASPGYARRDEALKTPITPPSAYLDFLRNLTPAMSPAATSTSTRFSFNEKPNENGADALAVKPSLMSPPSSEPALSRNISYESTSTNATTSSEQSTASEPIRPVVRRDSNRPETPRIIIPSTHFVKPGPRSSRTPRRLNMPASPFSPALNSAATAPSPYITSATPTSAAPWSATFSPRDYTSENPASKVSVRHVVTRTVTYCRTPLDPAPRGKRRKLEDTSAAETAVQAPPIKQEQIEEVELTEESATDTDLTDATASEAETEASTTA